MKHEESPLLVWKLLLVVAIIVISLSFAFEPETIITDRRYRALIQRIETIRIEREAFTVVFLGNSLLLRALPESPKTIEDALMGEFTGHGNNPATITVHKIILDGGSSQEIQRIAEKIMSLHPTAIVLQVDMIVSREYEHPKRGRLQAWAKLFRIYLKQYISPASLFLPEKNRSDEKDTPVQIDVAVVDKETDQDFALIATRKLWEGQTVSRLDSNFLSYRNLFKRISSSPTKLLILAMPVGETLTKIAPEGYFQQRTDAVRTILEPDASRLLQFPLVLPDDHFFDYRHLNSTGRERFFQWFVPALAQNLSEKG